MRDKPIYWLIPKQKLQKVHKDKIRVLREHHIVPQIIEDFGTFFDSYNHQRTSTVIIGDEFSEQDLFAGLIEINRHPELAATRIILSLSHIDSDLIRKATLMGFRDVIPLDLSNNIWFQRFNFSASGLPQQYKNPTPQMTLRGISGIKVPARVAWIKRDLMWIETKITMDQGAQFKLVGGLADYLGAKAVSLNVVEKRDTNLRYRFSAGYICKWSIPDSLKSRKKDLIDSLSDRNEKAPFKAYVAVSTYKIRHTLIKKLNSKRLSKNIALHKSGIVEEAKFLDPDILFIEKKLTEGSNRQLFVDLLENIRIGTPIYILGSDIDETAYRQLEDMRDDKFVYVRKFTPNFQDIIIRKLEKILPPSEFSSAFYIDHEDPLSFAEVSCSARLLKIHPEAVELATPFQLSSYGLIGVESSIFSKTLGRGIHAKIINSYHNEDPELQGFPYVVDCYLSDILSHERGKLADKIIRTFQEEMGRQVESHEYHSKVEDIPISDKESKNEKKVKKIPPEEQSFGEEFPKQFPSDDDRPVIKRRKETKSFSAFIKQYRRDFVILVFVISLFVGIFFILFYAVGEDSQQGKVYSDQLLKFQQRFQNDR